MANEFSLGPCDVFFTANTTGATETNLGYTNGGVTVSLETERQEIECDQLTTPLDEIMRKINLTVRCPFIDFTPEKIQLAIPGAVIVTDATTETKKKVLIKASAGKSILDGAGKLRLHPTEKLSTDVAKDLILTLAAPNGEGFELNYNKDDLKTVVVTFKAYAPTSGTNANVLAIFGDETATPGS